MLPFKTGAGEESRTLDLNLGKVALYQLSYSRKHKNYNVIFETLLKGLLKNPKKFATRLSTGASRRAQCLTLPAAAGTAAVAAATAAAAASATSSSDKGTGMRSSATANT